MPQNPLAMRAFLAALVLVLCCVARPASAASLSSVETTSLPSLTLEQPLIGLVTVEGRAVALSADQAWVLDAKRRLWERSTWRPNVAAGTLKSAEIGRAHV